MFEESDYGRNYNSLLFKKSEELIPKGWKIFPTPPFLRVAKPELPIMGLENKAWLFEDRNIIGQCVRPNCRSLVQFYVKEPLGHTFFFDIDEKIDDLILIRQLQKISTEFKLSHMIITNTTKGHHIWVTEIRKHKVSWYPLFKRLMNTFESDYEFMGQWILRINNKAHLSAPVVNTVITNNLEENMVNGTGYYRNKDISMGHLTILEKYAHLPCDEIGNIIKNNIVKKTFARIVQYYSWDIPHRRAEHLEEF